METYTVLPSNQQMIQGIPIGKLNNLDIRVKKLEQGGSGPSVPISLINGGTGLPNTRTNFSTSGSVTAYSPTTVDNNYTGSSASMRGMVAQTDGTEIVFTNSGGLLIFFNESSSASAANRFSCPTGLDMNVPVGASARWRYSITTNRWLSVGGYVVVDGTNNAAVGVITGTAYNTFNNKVDQGGGGSTNTIPYYSGAHVIASTSGHTFDPINARVGIQTGTFNEKAPHHVANNLGTTVADVSVGSASIINEDTIPDISSATATQVQGFLYAVTGQSATPTYTLQDPTAGVATINYSGSGYLAIGLTIDYILYAENIGGSFDGTPSASFSAGADDSSTNPYQIDITWSLYTGGEVATNYRIYRQINGGGFNDYVDIGTSGSFSDQNNLWTGGTNPPLPQETTYSYTASGQTIDYQIWQYNDDGMGGLTYSRANSVASTTNDASGATFYNTVSWSQNNGGSQSVSGFRVYRNIGGAGFNDYYETTSSSFNDGDGSMSWTSGSPDPTPQYPDYVANGSTRTYNAYGESLSPSGAQVYSFNGFSYGFSDDNSNNTYVVNHSVSGLVAGVRIIGNPDGVSLDEHFEIAGIPTTENRNSWLSGATVTPNEFGILSDGSTLNRDYNIYAYKTVGAGRVYSATPFLVSVSDPNNAQFYYVSSSFSIVSGADGYRIVRQINTGGFLDYQDVTTNVFFDDALSSWTNTPVLTPTSYFPSTQIIEQSEDNEGIQIVADANGKGSIVVRSTVDGTIRGVLQWNGGNEWSINAGNSGLANGTGWVSGNSSNDLEMNGSSVISQKVNGTEVVSIQSSRAIFQKPVSLPGYTVSTLPTGAIGMTAYVTDALLPTYLGSLTGGGSVVCPVFYNGSAWRVG